MLRPQYALLLLGRSLYPTPLRVVRGERRQVTPPKRVPRRGVREADCTRGGLRVFEAINSAGDCVKRMKLEPGVNEEIIREWLWGHLERVDPRPRLHRLTGIR